MNIYQRLNEIKKKIAYIRKDKRVETYMAVTHDAVTAETRPFFIELGVMVIPSEIHSAVIDAGKTGKGTSIVRFEGLYQIDFVNIDEPTDRTYVQLTAHALDHGDKAPGKAISYATKYAVLKVLNLETGENEESRVQPAEEPEPQVSDYLKKAAESEAKKGTEAYKVFYKQLSVEDRAAVSTLRDTMQALAKQADAEQVA